MSASMSKAKGAAFERSICRKMSLWITDGKKDDCFWRSAMSGGRATRRAKKGVEVSTALGDICAVTPEGHKLTDKFIVECKHARSFGFQGFILSGTGVIMDWWCDLTEKAVNHKREPMLVARQNNYPILVLVWQGRYSRSNLRCILPDLACSIYLLDELVAVPYDVWIDGRV